MSHAVRPRRGIQESRKQISQLLCLIEYDLIICSLCPTDSENPLDNLNSWSEISVEMGD